MIVTFKEKYLSELYETGRTSDKKHRFQPDIARKYRYCIKALESASSIESLYQVKSLHYEVLKGDREGISSVRVNLQYRIEFTVTNEGTEPVITVCNILELSNHYK
jgi:proteic killer suppression protein